MDTCMDRLKSLYDNLNVLAGSSSSGKPKIAQTSHLLIENQLDHQNSSIPVNFSFEFLFIIKSIYVNKCDNVFS